MQFMYKPSSLIITQPSIHLFAWRIFWKAGRITGIWFCGEELQKQEGTQENRIFNKIPETLNYHLAKQLKF